MNVKSKADIYSYFPLSDSRSLPDESWRSGSGEEQPLSGLLGVSLLCFLFGTVTYTRAHTHTHTHTYMHTHTRKDKQVKHRPHTPATSK